MQLIEMYGRLESINGHVVTNTSTGHESVQAFLKALEEFSEAFSVKCACRRYRSTFTSNYKFLFPDNCRNYRIDVLEASIEQHHAIWVNGDKFEFSVHTLESAEQLQEAWRALIAVLTSGTGLAQACFPAEEVCQALSQLDIAWASFERVYISELIGIEAQARGLIVQVVEQERLLALAEEQSAGCKASEGFSNIGVEVRRRSFVGCIARLNSVANNRRKGRDDLGADILEEASALLDRRSRDGTTEYSAALVLASDVVESFNALRSYFRQVAACLERVDPHLCKNAGLVEKLVDWEESWEIGVAYVCNMPVLNAFSDVVAELRKVQTVAPTFKQMCDDCDVELFLCVPRLLWLRFLADPADCGELLKNLLPHRFPDAAMRSAAGAVTASSRSGRVARESTTPQLPPCPGDDGLEFSETFLVDHDLSGLRADYQKVCQQLLRGGLSVSTAWELLARRAVVGPDGAEGLYAELLAPLADQRAAMAAVEGLMRELEQWSIELQRHSPEEWNRCSSLFVRCLLGVTSAMDGAPAAFQV